MGWPYPIRGRPWIEVKEFEAQVWKDHPEGQYLLDIIDSVLASGVQDQLAVQTSMHDLMVVSQPVPDTPTDVLFVRAPGSLKAPKRDHVIIEYVAASGRNTISERPTADAVRLFWRFVEEKFGIRAIRPIEPSA